MRRLEAVGAENRDGASSLRTDGFRESPCDGVLARGVLARGVAARLGDLDALAAEDAVWAVIEAGRRTGRVGDLGCGFGEEWSAVFFELSCDGVPERAGFAGEDVADFVAATFAAAGFS